MTEKPVPAAAGFIERDSAPMIFFDAAPTLATFNGIIAVTVSAMFSLPMPDGTIKTSQSVVAHLRANIKGAIALRDALDRALLLATPVEGEKN